MKLLCVYCSSSDRLDPKYYAAAEELGRELVARGWGLVYGGGKTGWRTWSRKRNFPEDPRGDWRVDLETPDGQLIERLEFRVS